MELGEQLIKPTAERLRLSAQLGVSRIVIDTRPNAQIIGEDGAWEARKVLELRRWIESFGHKLEVMALDVGSILLDSIRNLDRARATAERLKRDILAAAEGGVSTLKYNVQMVGITRTGVVEGRGGVKCSRFCSADYTEENDKAHSYWGVVLPGSAAESAGGNKPALRSPETAGQVLASETPGVSVAEAWRAIEFLIEAIVPTAEEAGIRLAGHPQDPAYPPEGLNNVHHVVASLDGMRRFIDLAAGSPAHGLNFCQGTIAEMSDNPNAYVLEAIRMFGGEKKIFMVHFRNILGGYLNFRECFPDEGSVDMAACIRAYDEVGYRGILCPDHVPFSELDPDRERFFAYALGYTKALIQTCRVGGA